MLDDPAYSLASTGRDLWATTEGGVARIDAAARQVLGGPVDLEAGSGSEIAAGEGALWVTDTIDNSRDPSRPEDRAGGRRSDRGRLNDAQRDRGRRGRGLGAARPTSTPTSATVVPIDPATNQAGQAIRIGSYSSTEALAVGEGGVWAAGGEDDESRLVRVDPATRELDTRSLPFEDGISAVAVGQGAVWVLDGQGLTVIRVDPATIKPVGQPIAVAAGGGQPARGHGRRGLGAQPAPRGAAHHLGRLSARSTSSRLTAPWRTMLHSPGRAQVDHRRGHAGQLAAVDHQVRARADRSPARRPAAARRGRRRGSRWTAAPAARPARGTARGCRASRGRSCTRAGSGARGWAAAASRRPAAARRSRPAERSKNITAAGFSGGRPLSA